MQAVDPLTIEQTVKSAVSKAVMELMRAKALKAADPNAKEEEKVSTEFAVDAEDADRSALQKAKADLVMAAIRKAAGLPPLEDGADKASEVKEEGPEATPLDKVIGCTIQELFSNLTIP